jgi:hypothetical protein
MRNVSDKSCGENQNTHFVFDNLFFENRAGVRKGGKIWYSQAPHDNMPPAHYTLDT